MDAGAADADPSNVRDAAILELCVDDEPAFAPAARLTAGRYRRPVRWGRLTTLLLLVVCAAWLTIALAPLDSSQPGVRLRDIERSVGFDLSGQLLGDLRVNSVRCVRHTETDARRVAELFDKSGDGPTIQRVTVRLERDTGEYFWQAGPE